MMVAFAMCGVFALAGCEKEEVANASEENLVTNNQTSQTRASGPSASGHGTLSIENTTIAGDGFRQFSFHAKEKKNGVVSGSGVLTYTGGVLKTRFNINCLEVNGNVATMSGTIISDSQTPQNEGLLYWFKVVDNGGGSNADPDQLTLFYIGSDPLTYSCSADYGVTLYDIEGGNVQVKE
ncbi:MAG: hypothetical protein CMC08_00530 [Flavobacteriaceae bacterium]|nr:hypothetical protein [Flavobacteriaceae bacterium]